MLIIKNVNYFDWELRNYSFYFSFFNRTSDACNLIRLFHLIHPNSKSAESAKKENLDGLDLIKVGQFNYLV